MWLLLILFIIAKVAWAVRQDEIDKRKEQESGWLARMTFTEEYSEPEETEEEREERMIRAIEEGRIAIRKAQIELQNENRYGIRENDSVRISGTEEVSTTGE